MIADRSSARIYDPGQVPYMAVDLEERVRTELTPDLEVLRRLGAGATAVVFLAREIELRRLVAVKVLRHELAADPVIRRRFEREAQSVARITHGNVTAVHRIGRLSDGVPFMVMEFIEGRTFGDIASAVGTIDVDEAIRLLAGLASALAAAHERGIIHRDVRPSNVFVENRSGRVVLCDFGIAAIAESGSEHITRLTAVGQRLGDLRYMSPEQIRGESATAQSDVYSFGILAYELLTGHGPYGDVSPAEAIKAHLDRRPDPLQPQRPGLGLAIAALIEHCLAKQPNLRPSAQDLADALKDPRAFEAKSTAVATGTVGEFLAELKRRRVYHVVVGYTIFTAATLEVAGNVLPELPVPDYVYKLLVVVMLAAFPVAVTLSWVYDLTRGGIMRTDAIAGEGASRRSRILAWIGLACSVALSFLIGALLLRN